jgi:hypothetical protein
VVQLLSHLEVHVQDTKRLFAVADANGWEPLEDDDSEEYQALDAIMFLADDGMSRLA